MAVATSALILKVTRTVGEGGVWSAYDRLYGVYINQDGHIKKLIRETTSQKTEVERLTVVVASSNKELATMKPNVDGTKTGLQDQVKEYIRQIADLRRLLTAAETHGETVKLENEILVKYMSELQQAIGDMSFVLNETIDEKMVKEDDMKIHRPDALVDDELTRAGKAFVLEHIAKFEEALTELPMMYTERAQYQKYGETLGGVVQDMSGLLSETISGDEILVIRPLKKKWNSDENLKTLNGKMTTVIGQFEGSIDTFKEHKKRQESEVATLKIANGTLEERVGSQNVRLDALTQPSPEQGALIAL